MRAKCAPQQHVSRVHIVCAVAPARRHRGPHEQGDHRSGAQRNEDQGRGSPREEVQRVDRRFHPGLLVYLPANVDC